MHQFYLLRGFEEIEESVVSRFKNSIFLKIQFKQKRFQSVISQFLFTMDNTGFFMPSCITQSCKY